jgi:FkbM family methyltransferase
MTVYPIIEKKLRYFYLSRFQHLNAEDRGKSIRKNNISSRKEEKNVGGLLPCLLLIEMMGVMILLFLISSSSVAATFVTNTDYSRLNRLLWSLKISSQDQMLSVLDVGAHDGSWSRTLNSAFFNRLKFYHIEGNYDHESSLLNSGNWVFMGLVGDRDDEIVQYHMSTHPDSTTGNSIFCELTEYYDDHIVEIRSTLKIDTILTRSGLSVIPFDIAKFDIQGSEVKALLGARQTIALMNNGVIILECSLLPMNGPDAASLLDVMHTLQQFGYNAQDILEEHYLLDTSQQLIPIQVDILFAREDRSFLQREENMGYYSWPPRPRHQML